MKYSSFSCRLDKLYYAAGLVGSCFLILILILIVLQMITRWIGYHLLPGSIEYIGYCMAASSLLCLSYALVKGSHIRVDLISAHTKGKIHFALCLWCFVISIVITLYFVYYQTVNIWYSYELNDISQGEDATPLWIPQIVMPIGGFIFLIALIDHLIRLILYRKSTILE